MKSIIIMTTLFLNTVALAESAQDKVNYHLRKMQTVLDAKSSAARIEALKAKDIEIDQQNDYYAYLPTYGIGDEATGTPTNPQPVIPRHQTLEEQIRNEVEQRQITNVHSAQEEPYGTNAEFIRAFKEKAASQGVQLEVDPITYEVREIK